MEQSNFAIQGMKDNQVRIILIYYVFFLMTVAAMKAGLKTMQTEYKKMNIDKIENMQDDMEDMLELNNEIQDALSRQYDTPDIDETELEAELEALGNELEFDNDTSYLDEAIKTPAVPQAGPSREPQGVAVDEFGLPKIPAS